MQKTGSAGSRNAGDYMKPPADESANASEDEIESLSAQRSTLKFAYCGHVPYKIFEPQVRELCRLLWQTSIKEVPEKQLVKDLQQPPTGTLDIETTSSSLSITEAPKEFAIEHMRGGSFNRVIGITVQEQDKAKCQMVLRVPRGNLAEPEHDVAVLQFVQENVVVPIPEVIAYDFTTNNPLNAPYVLQKRILGSDLESKTRSYPELTHEQKKAFVDEFCQILVNLRSVEHPYAGRIETCLDEKGERSFTVGPFPFGPESDELIARRSAEMPFFKVRTFEADPELLEDSSGLINESEYQTPFFFLVTQFGRRRQVQLEMRPDLIWRKDGLMESFIKMTVQMQELGYLDALTDDDHAFCLTHYDLDPRNIMVDIHEDGKLEITGILDWDLAMFAPKWVHCRPPMWIWNWLDGGNEDQSKANDTPPTEEQRELKEQFEDFVGSDFYECSYHPGYRMARQLFHYALYPFLDEEAYDKAMKLVEDWSNYYEQHKPGIQDQDNEEDAHDDGEDFRSVTSDDHEVMDPDDEHE